MRTRITPNGRPSFGRPSLQIPAPGNLPTNVTLSGGIVRVLADFSGDLEDWDFTDLDVWIFSANVGAIRYCKFGEVTPGGSAFPLRIWAGADVQLIEYCDFFGATSAGVIDTFVSGKYKTLRFCRFLRADKDYLKPEGHDGPGGQLIYRNYFGPPANMPNVTPATWSAGSTYNTNDWVVDLSRNTRWAKSKIDGNIGNLIPTGENGDLVWDIWDPHSDAITVLGAANRLEISENCFDFLPAVIDPLPVQGLNNVLRLSRDTGSSLPYDEIVCRSNLCRSGNGTLYPVHIVDNGLGNFNGPISFTGNWFDPGSTNQYYYPGSLSLVDVWTNNQDATTGALIT